MTDAAFVAEADPYARHNPQRPKLMRERVARA